MLNLLFLINIKYYNNIYNLFAENNYVGTKNWYDCYIEVLHYYTITFKPFHLNLSYLVSVTI